MTLEISVYAGQTLTDRELVLYSEDFPTDRTPLAVVAELARLGEEWDGEETEGEQVATIVYDESDDTATGTFGETSWA
jgi:hypothetical protein